MADNVTTIANTYISKLNNVDLLGFETTATNFFLSGFSSELAIVGAVDMSYLTNAIDEARKELERRKSIKVM